MIGVSRGDLGDTTATYLGALRSQDMGAEGGCTEANIMVYLGVVEQRANELLSAADRVLQQVCAYSPIAIVMTRHCIHVSHLPSTCHISPPLVTSPLHLSHLPSTWQAKTMRGLAKREAGKKAVPKPATGKGRGR